MNISLRNLFVLPVRRQLLAAACDEYFIGLMTSASPARGLRQRIKNSTHTPRSSDRFVAGSVLFFFRIAAETLVTVGCFSLCFHETSA